MRRGEAQAQDAAFRRGNCSADRPVRLQVAMRVKELIRVRGLQTGDALPSYAELGEELAVSYVTVKRGMDDLVAEGIVLRQNGRGTFVARELARLPRPLHRLGLICPGSRHSLFAYTYLNEIMRGIMLGSPPQMDLHVFSVREDGLIGAAQLAKECVDGVILMGVENDDYLRTFAQWGTPGVVVDYCAQATPLDYVACDNCAAARQIVAHLAAQGHRRVAYVAGPTHNRVRAAAGPDAATLMVRKSSDVRERRLESLRAFGEAGIHVEELTLKGINEDLTACIDATATELAGRSDRPTAVLAESDFLVSALRLGGELQRRGLRVPEDLSLCALAVGSGATYHGRTITGCRFDFVGMGRLAAETLAARCSQPGDPAPQGHRVGFEFVAGETTVRAPEGAKPRVVAKKTRFVARR